MRSLFNKPIDYHREHSSQFIGNLTFIRGVIFRFSCFIIVRNECDFMSVWFGSVSLGAFVCSDGWGVRGCECDSWTVSGSFVWHEKVFRVVNCESSMVIRGRISHLASLACKSAPTVILLGFLKSHSTWNAASPVVTSSGSCWTTMTLEKMSPSWRVWHWPSGNFIVSDRAPLPWSTHGALFL